MGGVCVPTPVLCPFFAVVVESESVVTAADAVVWAEAPK